MKKTMVSFVTFIFLLVSMTTVTYAWLTVSTVNHIEGIEIGAKSEGLLEISLDGENYYKDLPEVLLNDYLSKLKLTDVTSLDGYQFNKGPKSTKEVVKGIDYLSLTFYFRTKDMLYTDIYLANNITNEVTYDNTRPGTFVTSKGKTWRSNYYFMYDADEYIAIGDTRTYYIKDAVRVSMIEELLDEDDIREENQLQRKIFDLSGNEHRGYGKPYGALDYYNRSKNKHIHVPNEVPNTIYKLSEFEKDAPFALNENSKVMTLIKTDDLDQNGKNYYKGKLTINLWIEGWDADLFDSVFGDVIKAQFEFKAVIGLKKN